MSITTDRIAPVDAPIIDAVAARWSTRVFDADAPIDEAALASALEAGRWASSAFNLQPWRFIVARRGTPTHAKIVNTLTGFNQSWAGAAGALLVILAETEDESGKPNATAAYDAGQAAGFVAVQAHVEGLHTHQMSGFHADELSAAFEIDARFQPVTVTALGTLGDVSQAPEKIREIEAAPRARRPLSESVFIDD
ncbi:MAG TPA: nitroreductase family protein [Pseudolysinimonas sp.]|nr:nitroreductase family protein [Pseudolysinimonas sp.]